MLVTIAAAGISLFVTGCIDGTLHGEPKTLCREFQIRHYDTVETCSKAEPQAIKDFLEGLKPYGLGGVRVAGSRCGPPEQAEGDDL